MREVLPALPQRQCVKTIGKAQDELLGTIKVLRMEIQELRDEMNLMNGRASKSVITITQTWRAYSSNQKNNGSSS